MVTDGQARHARTDLEDLAGGFEGIMPLITDRSV
jgi:hypothetical protein